MEGYNGKSNLNYREISQAMSMAVIKQLRREAIKHCGPVLIQWAKNMGAQIKPSDEGAAIDALADIFPEPQQFPTVEIVSNVPIKTNSETQRAPRKGASITRKASEFTKLVVPDGITPPLCPTKKNGGKGDACGKAAKYLLDEHDEKFQECAALTCNHCYCGTHVTKASSDEINEYNKLNADKKPVTIGGDNNPIEPSPITHNDAATSKVSGAVFEKLLKKVKEKTEEQAAKNKGN